MDSALESLQTSELFKEFDAARLVRLLGAVEPVAFDAGKMVIRAGEQAKALYLWEQGAVRLETPTGKLVDAAANACGEELAAGLQQYGLNAIANERLVGWMLPRESVQGFLQETPQCGQRAVALLASRLAGETLPLGASKKASKKEIRASWLEIVGWALSIISPPLVYLLLLQTGGTVQAGVTAAICTAMILLWVFSLLDEFIPPLVAMVATLFIGLAPPSVALAGFSSPGLITLLGVFSLAAIITASGLSYRIMLWLLLKLPDRPVFHQLALLFGGYLLSPITPSGNNRLSLLLPLYRDMLEGLRLTRGGAAATALMAASFSGAMLMSPMMSTSKSANIAAVNLLPAQIQEEFIGLFWLVAAAVAAIGVTLIHALISARMFSSNESQPLPKPRIAQQLTLLGPLSAGEWLAIAGFLFFLLGAATYSWHHVPPSWLAGCVLVGLLLSGQFSKQDFRRQIDWPMLFFLLGVDSITRVMEYHGLQASLASAISGYFGFIDGRIELFILAALVTTLVIRLALPVTAGMLVSVVVLLPVAAAHGIHPWICVFLTAMFSDIWFLPYQSSVYLQVLSQGFGETFDQPRFFRYNLWMNLSRVVVAYASIPWWNWLGLH
jgi:di/tricarboxylate transporter